LNLLFRFQSGTPKPHSAPTPHQQEANLALWYLLFFPPHPGTKKKKITKMAQDVAAMVPPNEVVGYALACIGCSDAGPPPEDYVSADVVGQFFAKASLLLSHSKPPCQEQAFIVRMW